MDDLIDELADVMGPEARSIMDLLHDAADDSDIGDAEDDADSDSDAEGEVEDDASGAAPAAPPASAPAQSSSLGGSAGSDGEAPVPRPSGPGQGPLTAKNCIDILSHVTDISELPAHLPNFVVSRGPFWGVNSCQTGDEVGKLSTIRGTLMKAECRRHKPRCTLICEVEGHWTELEALLCKWLIAGSEMTMSEHRLAATQLCREWRARF